MKTGAIPTTRMRIRDRELHSVAVDIDRAQVILPPDGCSARIMLEAGGSIVNLLLDDEKGWQVECGGLGYTLGRELTPAGFYVALEGLRALALESEGLEFEELPSGGVAMLVRLDDSREAARAIEGRGQA